MTKIHFCRTIHSIQNVQRNNNNIIFTQTHTMKKTNTTSDKKHASRFGLYIIYSHHTCQVNRLNSVNTSLHWFVWLGNIIVIGRVYSMCGGADETRLTFVELISCFQWRSRIAGFCSSPTARRDVTMFFTVASRHVYASHDLISLSSATGTHTKTWKVYLQCSTTGKNDGKREKNQVDRTITLIVDEFIIIIIIRHAKPLISFANFLHSMSMFSTSTLRHGVVFQSLMHEWTRWT